MRLAGMFCSNQHNCEKTANLPLIIVTRSDGRVADGLDNITLFYRYL